MIDIYEIYDVIFLNHRRYVYLGEYARCWNLKFMNNLYEFGKDFR